MKKKTTTKILSALLTVVMLLSAVQLSGFAGLDLFIKASAEDMYANILSVDIEPVKLIENYDGNYINDYIYNEKTYSFDESEEYFYYYVNPDKFTVNYKDGTSCVFNENEIYELFDYAVSYNDNQSYDKQWNVGNNYSVIYDFKGLFSSCLSVEIIQSPVKDIEIIVNKTEYVENVDGYITYDYDYENNIQKNYFRYDLDYEINIDYKDGFDYDSWAYSVEDNQSSATPWNVGKHTVTVSAYGFEKSFEVEVIQNPNPIINVTVISTESLMADIDGFLSTYSYYDEDTDEYIDKFWFEYNTYNLNPIIKIDFADGTSFEGKKYELYDKYGYNIEIEDNQSCDNQWSVGKHELFLYIGITSVEFNVEVIENPNTIINATVISTKPLLAEIDGYLTYYSYYDENTEEYIDKSWFEYSTYYCNPIMKLDFSNGFSYEGTINEIYDKYGYDIQINDTQSYNNQWSVGKHEVYLNIGSIHVKFEVEVVESPITKIEIIKVPDKTTYSVGEYVDFKGMVVRVFYNTDEYTDITFDELCYLYKSYYDPILKRTVYIENEKIIDEIGTHSIEFNCCGQKDSFTVIGKENKTKEISIENNDKRQLIINFTDKDGNTIKATVLDFIGRAGDGDGLGFNEMGLLFTDIGVFKATIIRNSDGEASVSITNLSNNEELLSNKLEECYWINSYWSCRIPFDYLYNIIYDGQDYHYNCNELSQETIDDIILISLSVSLENIPYVYIGNCCAYSIEDVLKTVNSIFALNDIDLTKSSFYDSKTNKLNLNYDWGSGPVGIIFNEFSFTDGYYTYIRTYNSETSSGTVKIILDEDYKIVNFSITNGLNEVEDLVKGVSLSSKEITTDYNRTFTLTPTVEVEGEPEYTVEYTSSNPKVVTVDNDGNVKTTGKGNTTITVTVTDSDGNVLTDTCNINVKFTFWQWLLYIICFGWIWM